MQDDRQSPDNANNVSEIEPKGLEKPVPSGLLFIADPNLSAEQIVDDFLAALE